MYDFYEAYDTDTNDFEKPTENDTSWKWVKQTTEWK